MSNMSGQLLSSPHIMQVSKRYQYLKPLGKAGFDSVFQAFDTILQRKVTVKRLANTDDQNSVHQQLLNEAKVLASIKHPNIVSVYDVLSNESGSALIMEPSKGVSLSDLVKKHLLIGFDFKNVALQMLRAISAAHKAGIHHCDLSPTNVRLSVTSEGHYNAKIYGFAASALHEENVSSQSDLYALGRLFQLLLTGSLPSNSKKQSGTDLISVRSDLTPPLINWINQFIPPHPAERTQNCTTAIEELSAITFGESKQEFTLPTHLKLESSNSRVVRPISIESLTHKISDTTLTTQIPAATQEEREHSQQFQQHCSTMTEMPPTNTEVTHNSEWFFNINGVVKGPIQLEQLQNLCRANKIKPTHLIWHPYFGEWIKAESCEETKEHLNAKLKSLTRLSSRCITQPNSNEQFRLLGPAQGEKSSIVCEAAIVLIGAATTAGAVYLQPESLHLIVAGYALLLFIAGFVYTRFQQYKSGKSWFVLCLFLPIVGDLLHTVAKPSFKSTLATLMLLTGAIQLGYFTVNQLDPHPSTLHATNHTQFTSELTTPTTILATRDTKSDHRH